MSNKEKSATYRHSNTLPTVWLRWSLGSAVKGGLTTEGWASEYPYSSMTDGKCSAQYKSSSFYMGTSATAGLTWAVGGVGSRLALTGVHVDLLVAVSAVHGAAPVELALTLGGPADPRRVVASTAAHHLTAVDAARRPVADPPPGSHRPWGGRERRRKGQWGFKVKVFHMICFAFIRIYL